MVSVIAKRGRFNIQFPLDNDSYQEGCKRRKTREVNQIFQLEMQTTGRQCNEQLDAKPGRYQADKVTAFGHEGRMFEFSHCLSNFLSSSPFFAAAPFSEK